MARTVANGDVRAASASPERTRSAGRAVESRCVRAATGGDGSCAAFSSALDAVTAAIEVNRAARLMALAHGGQVLASDTAEVLERSRVLLRPLGDHPRRRPVAADNLSLIEPLTSP